MPARIKPRKATHVYLALWRAKIGFTQQQVGERIGKYGVDKGTVSRWENSKRTPSINVLAAYAEALNVPVGNLFRKPTDRASVDEMLATAPELHDDVVDMVTTMLKRHRSAA